MCDCVLVSVPNQAEPSAAERGRALRDGLPSRVARGTAWRACRYLEQRFDRKLRTLASCIFMLKIVCYLALVLCAFRPPALR